MIKLGVNIDHIATLREARKGNDPEPVAAAKIAELHGADGITVHLREDERHIKYRDVFLLRKVVQTKLNLEMSIVDDIVKKAIELKPNQATLVPEKREEITTEGGLDVVSGFDRIKTVIEILKKEGILVSLFINPDMKQVESSIKTGADAIEIHTGHYANAVTEKIKAEELRRIFSTKEFGIKNGIIVNAGHGLNYWNVSELAAMEGFNEFNIGHSIVARAVLSGLGNAVKDMKELLVK